MQTVDEITGRIVDLRKTTRIVIDFVEDQIIFGYTAVFDKVITFYINAPHGYERFYGLSSLKDRLFYSNLQGIYILKESLTEEDMLRETYTMAQGIFPYHFDKRYEAIESFNIFKDKQIVLEEKAWKLGDHLKYSFGLEFETSQGVIPEDLCFRDGLIPLRDGSIAGLEYSTVVLSGNKGISLLKQQVESLEKFTGFNKECSLHMHFGGFPLDPRKIYNLYVVCKNLESELQLLVPEYTFRTANYKENGKDYCMQLPTFRSFEDLYGKLVGRNFYGDLTQPHPADIKREAKWRINTRYYWLNLINLICYDVNKTVEFRFLRPTYNFNKILLWIYIFNAILIFSEDYMINPIRKATLKEIIEYVYPPELAKAVLLGIVRLTILRENQAKNKDSIGRDIYFENILFEGDLNY